MAESPEYHEEVPRVVQAEVPEVVVVTEARTRKWRTWSVEAENNRRM